MNTAQNKLILEDPVPCELMEKYNTVLYCVVT